MLISEIFYSIQGEGVLTGVPSVFVRTSGCNLRCNWCDTPYASWNPEGEQRSVAQVLAEIQNHPAKHVVLTGGEPMIAKDIAVLAKAIRTIGHHITIETAATVMPEGIACDLASLSPKLLNSAPDARLSVTWRKNTRQPAGSLMWCAPGSMRILTSSSSSWLNRSMSTNLKECSLRSIAIFRGNACC